MKTLTQTLVLGTALALTGISTLPSSAANIMFVMDASGSMKKDAGNGYSRMDNAKYAIARMLTDVDGSNNYGLTVYGHRKARACSDIQVVADVGSVDAGFVNGFVQELQPIGETPIAESVRLAANGFQHFPDQDNQVVLVTDGIEECGGDVCSLGDELAQYNVGLKVNVVGFTLNEQQQETVRCLSDKTGGKYYDAQDGKALEAAFAQVKQDIVLATPEPAVQKVSVTSNVWFEDNFDGDQLGEHWTVENEDPDAYAVEDGKLLMIFPDTGESTVGEAKTTNLLRLKQPMPKGDWTMTTRYEFTAQTQAEWLRMGVSSDAETSLYGSYQMYTYNYAMTQVFARIDKLSKGKHSDFNTELTRFETRDVPARSEMFAEAIEGMQLKLEKKGRTYTLSAKLEGSDSKGWIPLQKMSSIRSPGKYLTLLAGNQANGYGPKNGEGLVEIDWVKVTTN